MAEEKKDSFTFSDKLKNSKPAGLFSNRMSASKIAAGGKPKKTLFERTKRDAPFLAAALIALLLMPILVKYTAKTAGAGALGAGSYEVNIPEARLDDLASTEPYAGSSIDFLRSFLGKKEEPKMDAPVVFPQLPTAAPAPEKTAARPSTPMQAAQRSAARSIQGATPRQPATLKNLVPGKNAGTGGGFKSGNWGGLKGAAQTPGPGAPRVASRPVSLTPLIAGGKGRSMTAEAALGEAQRSLGALNKGPAMQALWDAQLRDTPVGGGQYGGLELGGNTGGAGAGAGGYNSSFQPMKPWWWDMYQQREQMKWEFWFKLWSEPLAEIVKGFMVPFMSCLLTGDEEWSMEFFGGATETAGTEDKCMGMTRAQWRENPQYKDFGFSEKICKITFQNHKDAKNPWSEGKPSSGNRSAWQQRLACLGIPARDEAALTMDCEIDINKGMFWVVRDSSGNVISKELISKDAPVPTDAGTGNTGKAEQFRAINPLSSHPIYFTTEPEGYATKGKWETYHYLVVDRFLVGGSQPICRPHDETTHVRGNTSGMTLGYQASTTNTRPYSHVVNAGNRPDTTTNFGSQGSYDQAEALASLTEHPDFDTLESSRDCIVNVQKVNEAVGVFNWATAKDALINTIASNAGLLKECGGTPPAADGAKKKAEDIKKDKDAAEKCLDRVVIKYVRGVTVKGTLTDDVMDGKPPANSPKRSLTKPNKLTLTKPVRPDAGQSQSQYEKDLKAYTKAEDDYNKKLRAYQKQEEDIRAYDEYQLMYRNKRTAGWKDTALPHMPITVGSFINTFVKQKGNRVFQEDVLSEKKRKNNRKRKQAFLFSDICTVFALPAVPQEDKDRLCMKDDKYFFLDDEGFMTGTGYSKEDIDKQLKEKHKDITDEQIKVIKEKAEVCKERTTDFKEPLCKQKGSEGFIYFFVDASGKPEGSGMTDAKTDEALKTKHPTITPANIKSIKDAAPDCPKPPEQPTALPCDFECKKEGELKTALNKKVTLSTIDCEGCREVITEYYNDNVPSRVSLNDFLTATCKDETLPADQVCDFYVSSYKIAGATKNAFPGFFRYVYSQEAPYRNYIPLNGKNSSYEEPLREIYDCVVENESHAYYLKGFFNHSTGKINCSDLKKWGCTVKKENFQRYLQILCDKGYADWQNDYRDVGQSGGPAPDCGWINKRTGERSLEPPSDMRNWTEVCDNTMRG